MMHSLGRKGNLPNTVFNRLTCIFGLLLPIVHLTNDVNGRGIGCPFAEDPCTILLTMKSEVQISVCKIAKRTGLLCRLMNLPGSILEAAKDSIGEIVKVRQVTQHLKRIGLQGIHPLVDYQRIMSLDDFMYNLAGRAKES